METRSWGGGCGESEVKAALLSSCPGRTAGTACSSKVTRPTSKVGSLPCLRKGPQEEGAGQGKGVPF